MEENIKREYITLLKQFKQWGRKYGYKSGEDYYDHNGRDKEFLEIRKRIIEIETAATSSEIIDAVRTTYAE